MKNLKTDVLVAGSGIAGALFALELAQNRTDLQITIVCKRAKNQSSSYLAQGGIAAVLPETGDSIEQHIQDTLSAGANANDPEVVEYFVSHAPEAIEALEKWGVCFDQNSVGVKSLALEGGHSAARVLHHQDSTGRHIMQQLHEQLGKFSNIEFLEDVAVFDLIQSEKSKKVKGAFVWDNQNNQAFSVQAEAVVLCMGGVGNLYKFTTNPSTALGQGIALAEKAGAKVKDIQNIQFHPTALWNGSGSKLSLISEALRGAGAVLINEYGERFMENIHPQKDLAPRDVVARSIKKQLQKQKLPYVFLDATSVPYYQWLNHFPGILRICVDAGIDPRIDWIPVVPAAHYSCGGIETNVNGKTAVEGLFILGESACTGLHGANRLASNSLLEATLMATGLAKGFAVDLMSNSSKTEFSIEPKVFSDGENATTAENHLLQVQEVMQSFCGVIKTTSGLEIATDLLQELRKEASAKILAQSIELIGLLQAIRTAELIVKSSLEATENKGVFFNEDISRSGPRIFRKKVVYE